MNNIAIGILTAIDILVIIMLFMMEGRKTYKSKSEKHRIGAS